MAGLRLSTPYLLVRPPPLRCMSRRHEVRATPSTIVTPMIRSSLLFRALSEDLTLEDFEVTALDRLKREGVCLC